MYCIEDHPFPDRVPTMLCNHVSCLSAVSEGVPRACHICSALIMFRAIRAQRHYLFKNWASGRKLLLAVVSWVYRAIFGSRSLPPYRMCKTQDLLHACLGLCLVHFPDVIILRSSRPSPDAFCAHKTPQCAHPADIIYFGREGRICPFKERRNSNHVYNVIWHLSMRAHTQAGFGAIFLGKVQVG